MNGVADPNHRVSSVGRCGRKENAVRGWTVTPSYLINQDYATIWLAR